MATRLAIEGLRTAKSVSRTVSTYQHLRSKVANLSGQGQNLEDPVEAGSRNGRTGDTRLFRTRQPSASNEAKNRNLQSLKKEFICGCKNCVKILKNVRYYHHWYIINPNRIRRLVKFEIKLYQLDQIIDQLSARLRFQESALRLYTYMINCDQTEFRRVFKKGEKDYCRTFDVKTFEQFKSVIRKYHENVKDVDRLIDSRISLLEEEKASYYSKIANLDISPF
jgi:hypothetical protein